jgi:hypothetical protein
LRDLSTAGGASKTLQDLRLLTQFLTLVLEKPSGVHMLALSWGMAT